MSGLQTLLTTHQLAAGYHVGGRPITIAGPLSVSIKAGQMICLLGPNGAGKSTLMRTLSGLQPRLGGHIDILGDGGASLHDPSRLARKISLVLTDPVRNSSLTAYSLIALGRYPYSSWLGKLNGEDKRIITWAMEVTGIGAYAERKMGTLSDGERQKVMLARALAQDTPLMMLDEPTAHLDLPSRIQIMQLLHRLARTTQKGILLSTHELDLALQVADEVWLLQKAGGGLEKGAPEDLVLNGTFEAVFDKEGIHFDKNTGSFHIHAGSSKKIGLTGEGASIFWTRRALQREGFQVMEEASLSIHADPTGWTLKSISDSQTFTTITALLQALRNQSIYNEDIH
ncbi:MAG TPA: ABC transporter ATP-binding protein [Puia sp.]|nr:ABC transporter ATP-binding protein [Puia sp.]